MTTTLRPAGPLQRNAEDGTTSRAYDVCVNSRPVGRIHLATHPVFGSRVARILDLRIDEPDRHRGRGTVAALAAEEVARGWGCARIEAAVPATAPGALGLATALGYVERGRRLAKSLPPRPPALPDGVRARPMTGPEFTAWAAHAKAEYARDWAERGVPDDQARAKAERDYARLLPDGLATPGARLSVLLHEDTVVGTLWLAEEDGDGFVYDVEVGAEHRGRGHGRSLMLVAEAQCLEEGRSRVALHVFTGNTPALRLYESLGYEPVEHHLYKPLL
ncbi:GNAT family N-acetyltransferase [Streptomyces longispororuber]|uniref:GNAT family N-acetyltransferase n=1 Tax=Streptomyces longispororuber TaxID=68230 RepID=UPI0033FBA1AC